LNAALGTLGYTSDIHTPHGFRSTASTLLHDPGHDSGDIELQLAHVDRNQVRGIYNRSRRIAERAKMMQAYSDYLDRLRNGGVVVAISSKKQRMNAHKERIIFAARRQQYGLFVRCLAGFATNRK
jgi:hypothetical protein